jgi:hypothetical protein
VKRPQPIRRHKSRRGLYTHASNGSIPTRRGILRRAWTRSVSRETLRGAIRLTPAGARRAAPRLNGLSGLSKSAGGRRALRRGFHVKRSKPPIRLPSMAARRETRRLDPSRRTTSGKNAFAGVSRETLQALGRLTPAATAEKRLARTPRSTASTGLVVPARAPAAAVPGVSRETAIDPERLGIGSASGQAEMRVHHRHDVAERPLLPRMLVDRPGAAPEQRAE